MGQIHLKPKNDTSDDGSTIKVASEMAFKIQAILSDCQPCPSSKLHTLLK